MTVQCFVASHFVVGVNALREALVLSLVIGGGRLRRSRFEPAMQAFVRAISAELPA